MNTEEELFRRLLIRAGIVIRNVEEAQGMLKELDAVVDKFRPKGLKIRIWQELVSKHEKLKDMLKE